MVVVVVVVAVVVLVVHKPHWAGQLARYNATSYIAAVGQTFV